MMKMYSLLSMSAFARLAAASTLLLAACAPGQDAPTPSTVIDASRYVAVGDSYTAGLSSGGLTRASQDYSFANQLAQQLRRANAAATFTQPLLEAGSGSGYLMLADYTTTGIPRVRRVAGQAALPNPVINPAACGGPDTVRLLMRSATASALPQNLGAPGLLLSQIETAGLGNAANARPGAAFNPYFERLLPATDSRTYLQAVTTASASATFFTFFMGLDELMPYLRSGGTCSLPSATLLTSNAQKILNVLTTNGRPGIIAKLPVLYTLALLRQGQGLPLQRRLQAALGDTARVYISNFGVSEAITNDDYVLATALPRVGQRTPVVVSGTTLQLPYGRDIRNPLRDTDVLSSYEYSVVKRTVDTYNNELERLAQRVYKMPVGLYGEYAFNTSTVFPSFASQTETLSVSGVTYTTEPVRGNFFSLDYYSLTPRGNALLANAFILAINSAYRASIPTIDVNKLPVAAQ